MQTPTCPTCGSDKFLKVIDHQPGYTKLIYFRTAQGTISQPETVAPTVEYLCQGCGYFNGHSVDADWTPPREMSEQEVLAEREVVYPRRGWSKDRAGTQHFIG